MPEASAALLLRSSALAVATGDPELANQRVVAALTQRLTWSDGEGDRDDEVVRLLLERATVLHAAGDQPAAIADLDALLERAPAHPEALRFRADLAYNAGDVASAVGLWRRYLKAEPRPQRRGEIELQLSQVLAEKTGDVAGAIEQLARVVEQNPDNAQLRERLLGLCLRINDFEGANRELRALAQIRPTPSEKAREELRLGQLLRDRARDRAGARLAFERARALDPTNLDVVREMLDLLEPSARSQMLGATAASFRAAIAQSPGRSVLYERLGQVNAWQADVDARWIALVAVEALATPSIDQRQVLAQGRQQLAVPNRLRLDETARSALRGALAGPLAEMWRVIAPAVQVATALDPQKLGFTRGDRIPVKKLGDRYAPLNAVLFAFGLDEVELYVSSNRPGIARALAAETPILCVGADVAAGQSPAHRFQLARWIATLAEGIAALPDLRDAELAWTIAAAIRAVDAPLPPALAEQVAGDDTGIAERAKLLRKELSRRAKQVIQQLVQTRSASLGEVDGLRLSALAVGHRAGLAWAGDLAVALNVLDVGKGGRELTDSPLALDLVAWSVSEAHLELRAKLGIALRGEAPR
jgi:tetratricopeptide (TPR) repeat protein